MQCTACSRSEQGRRFYCSACISTRLAEHYTRTQQLRNALTLVTAKGSALLAGTERPATATAGNAFGVQNERLFKAEKWTLASRAYAAREAAAKAKGEAEETAKQLEERRAGLATRRANLSTARSLLSSLSPSSSSSSDALPPASSSLPLSLPALEARIYTLRDSLPSHSTELTRIRRVLATELLGILALKAVEQPLPDPFSPIPASSTPSASPSAASSGPATPFPRTYTFAHLALPPLSQLLTLRPAEFEALLSYLVTFVRLLALYEDVLLPFAPLPSGFGPGRAGIKAVPGLGTSLLEQGGDTASPERRSRDRDETPTPSRAGRRSAAAAASGSSGDAPTSGVGIDAWPLCFGSSSSKSKSSRGGAEATDRAEDDDAPSDASSLLTGASSSKSSMRGGVAEEASVLSSKKTARRARVVYAGAVALAYDLAYVCWIREQRQGRQTREWSEEDLEDLGGLIYRAAGVSDEVNQEQADEHSASSPFVNPTTPPAASALFTPSPGSNPPPFPLSFPALVRTYTALAFPTASTDASSRRKKGGSVSDESGGVEGSGTLVEGEEEEEDDEEWDFV
ncbi:hypothetical protein JCM10207_003112 [Rhodosporidiobolus poonsookiae]